MIKKHLRDHNKSYRAKKKNLKSWCKKKESPSMKKLRPPTHLRLLAQGRESGHSVGRVELDVGGTLFVTSKETLLCNKESSPFFQAMFSGAWKGGGIFIDRYDIQILFF